MRILALESADGACSIACGDGRDTDCRRSAQMRDSLSWLMRQLAELRAAHFPDWTDLDGIACCVGPGGFTGVRVSVGYAQGLGLATGLPVLGVSSLDALAQASLALLPRAAERWVALDARMGELYAARYRLDGDGQPQRQGEQLLVTPESLMAQLDSAAALLGPGFEAHPERFGDRTTLGLQLDAGAVLQAACRQPLVSWPAAVELAPVYLRQQVARTLAERGKT